MAVYYTLQPTAKRSKECDLAKKLAVLKAANFDKRLIRQHICGLSAKKKNRNLRVQVMHKMGHFHSKTSTVSAPNRETFGVTVTQRIFEDFI